MSRFVPSEIVMGRSVFSRRVRHGTHVMLAGMDEDGLDLQVALHFAHERSNFGEIGTGPYYVDDFQSAAHELVKCVRSPEYSI
jgi:hypothetical protein